MKTPLASHSHSTSDIFSCPGSWAGQFCWGGGGTRCLLCLITLHPPTPSKAAGAREPNLVSGSPDCGAVLGIAALCVPLVMERSQGTGRELGVAALPRGLVLGLSL